MSRSRKSLTGLKEVLRHLESLADKENKVQSLVIFESVNSDSSSSMFSESLSLNLQLFQLNVDEISWPNISPCANMYVHVLKYLITDDLNVFVCERFPLVTSLQDVTHRATVAWQSRTTLQARRRRDLQDEEGKYHPELSAQVSRGSGRIHCRSTCDCNPVKTFSFLFHLSDILKATVIKHLNQCMNLSDSLV